MVIHPAVAALVVITVTSSWCCPVLSAQDHAGQLSDEVQSTPTAVPFTSGGNPEADHPQPPPEPEVPPDPVVPTIPKPATTPDQPGFPYQIPTHPGTDHPLVDDPDHHLDKPVPPPVPPLPPLPDPRDADPVKGRTGPGRSVNP